MLSRRALTLFEMAGAAAAAYVVVALNTTAIDYGLAIQFLVVVFVLDLLDLSMPYGETLPVDSAIVVACLVLAGPLTAGFVAVAARIAVHLARKGTRDIDKTIALLARRLVAIGVCAYLLTIRPPVGGEGAGGLYAQGLAVGLVFVLTELLLAQLQAVPRLQERFSQLLIGNLALQGTFLAAEVSVAVLTVITYPQMNVWALLVMSLLIVLLRQSLALYLAIRQAYRSTIEALVAAIEAQDPRRKGHAERVEALARTIALHMGIRGHDLENLAYAALLHDVDMLGSDYDDGDTAIRRRSSETVSSVRFLSDVAPILRLCDGIQGGTCSHNMQQAAAVVAVASDFDDAANPRVGEMQSSAIDRVRAAGVDSGLVDDAKAVAAGLRSERAVAS